MDKIKELNKVLDTFDNRALGVVQVAEWCKVDPTTVYRWLSDSKQPKHIPDAKLELIRIKVGLV